MACQLTAVTDPQQCAAQEAASVGVKGDEALLETQQRSGELHLKQLIPVLVMKTAASSTPLVGQSQAEETPPPTQVIISIGPSTE